MKKTNLKKILLIAGLTLAGIAVLLVIYGFNLAKGPGVDQKVLELSPQPIDQPAPIPSSSQADTSENYCQFITPQIAEALGATAKPINIKGIIAGCDVPLPGGAWAQISSVGPFNRLHPADKPHFAQAVTVAGLEARIYNLGAPLSGECTLNLNTRSINSIIINVRWLGMNDLTRATKRAESCELAQKAGEVLAQAYVPLAGGTVYPKTMQQPTAAAISDHPCLIVDNAAALYGDVYNVADDKNGKQQARQAQTGSCTYQHSGNQAVVTLDRSGKTLPSYASMPAGKTTERQLGALPVRQIEQGKTCAMVVELQPGSLLDITYTHRESGSTACKLAELMQAKAISSLVNASSINR